MTKVFQTQTGRVVMTVVPREDGPGFVWFASTIDWPQSETWVGQEDTELLCWIAAGYVVAVNMGRVIGELT